MKKQLLLIAITFLLVINLATAVECDVDLTVTPCDISSNLTLNGGFDNVSISALTINTSLAVLNLNGGSVGNIVVAADDVTIKNGLASINVDSAQTDNLHVDNMTLTQQNPAWNAIYANKGLTNSLIENSEFTGSGVFSFTNVGVVGARNILTKNMCGSITSIHWDEIVPLEVSV